MSPIQSLPADSVRRVLDRVLSSPDFAAHDRSAAGGWLSRLGAWMWGLLQGALRWLFRDVDLHAPGWDVAQRLLVLAVASVGVWLVVRLVRMAMEGARRARGDVDGEGRVTTSRERTASEWEAAAREAGRAQRWREASLALYHAVILRLAERGVVHPDASKTPGDYSREARRSGAGGVGHGTEAPLDRFVKLFEPVAFGRTDPLADDYHHLRELAGVMGAHG